MLLFWLAWYLCLWRLQHSTCVVGFLDHNVATNHDNCVFNRTLYVLGMLDTRYGFGSIEFAFRLCPKVEMTGWISLFVRFSLGLFTIHPVIAPKCKVFWTLTKKSFDWCTAHKHVLRRLSAFMSTNAASYGFYQNLNQQLPWTYPLHPSSAIKTKWSPDALYFSSS